MIFYCSVQTGNSLYCHVMLKAYFCTQTRNRRESVVCMLAIDAFRDKKKKGGGEKESQNFSAENQHTKL